MSIPTSGRWPVLLSGRAIRELRLLAEDKRTLEIVRTKLKELSSGQFTKDNYSPVRGSCEHIPIYRARLSNDLRIIYVIDLALDDRHDNQYDHQLIKVFSVSSRARVAYDFWVKVSKYLAQQGVEYRDRCIYRETLNTANGAINVPARFDHQDYALAPASTELALDSGTNMNELHATIVLEKFAPVTRSLYNSILADMEVVLPMALNSDEKAIVRHHGTSVVVGRSGTGKTTALVYKMRANAQLATRSEASRPIRQLFVTRSKVLTRHIASNYHGLVESSEIALKSAEELEEMRKANQKYQNRELVEFDTEVDLRDDLPCRFSQLTDNNFPLFVSFDKLCELLEADIDAGNGSTPASVGSHRHHLITFSDFKHRYWPTFDYKLTRHLDPALVYSEILGVIKGYGRTLDMEEYLSEFSYKRSPLLANVRHQVYAIFEAYAKESRRSNEIDGADRSREIMSYYKSGLSPEEQVDYIFVDEVQDHLLRFSKGSAVGA